jgi:hypothetical protein
VFFQHRDFRHSVSPAFCNDVTTRASPPNEAPITFQNSFCIFQVARRRHKPWEKMDTKERTDSLKDEIADVRRQLAMLTGAVGEIGGAVKNLEKAIAKLKG